MLHPATVFSSVFFTKNTENGLSTGVRAGIGAHGEAGYITTLTKGTPDFAPLSVILIIILPFACMFFRVVVCILLKGCYSI